MQIVVNVLAHGLGVKDAVERPRIHWEDGVVHAEGGADLRGLEGAEITQWPKLNLFFGGANAVEVRPDGELAAAGDPRRGGDSLVVQ
jgi:gamma-glutamyltranspeptidase/glutathione hydrolase